MDSQTLVIGDPETDTDNDITGGSHTPSDRSRSFTKDHSDSESSGHMPGHMPFHQAMQVVQAEMSVQSQSPLQKETTQPQSRSSHQRKATTQSSRREQSQPMEEGINWADFIDDGNEYEDADQEWSVERHMRLAAEVENEERAALRNRLTAPPNEIRRRDRASRIPNDNTKQLRAKQLELVNQQLNLQEVLQGEAREKAQVVAEQLKLQKMLQENAMIANEEAKERLKAATAKRKAEEISLRLMELELQNKTKQ